MPNWKKIALSGSNPEFSSLTVDGAIEASKFSGSFSGSYQGDGSQLTGLSLPQVATVTDTFSSTTSKTVTHNFGTKNVVVQVYDTDDAFMIPSTIVTTDDNTVDITFFENASGRVVVAKGGHIVSGSTDFSSLTNAPTLLSSSAQITGFGFISQSSDGAISSSAQIVALGADIVSSSAQIADEISGSGNIRFEALNTKTGSIETDITALESFSSSLSTTANTYSGSFSGSFVGDGSNLSGVTSYTDSDNTDHLNTLGVVSSSAQITVFGFISQSSDGAISSSAQIAGLGAGILSGSQTLYSQSFNSATAVTASHNFGTKEVAVYVYDNNDNLFFPNNIKTATTSSVHLDFNTSRSGRVVVSKGGHVVEVQPTASLALTASYVDSALTASYVQTALTASYVQTALTASYVHSASIDGTVLSSSYAATSSRSVNKNTNSGSICFWQGSQSEYDALGSYDSSTVYFVV